MNVCLIKVHRIAENISIPLCHDIISDCTKDLLLRTILLLRNTLQHSHVNMTPTELSDDLSSTLFRDISRDLSYFDFFTIFLHQLV